MFENLEIQVDGPLAHLWLNRPQRLNALSPDTLRELAEAARWFNTQPEVRAVIVGGHGKAFSAGADLQGFPSPDSPDIRSAADAGRLMADAMEHIRAVTIARIHGWCVGGGSWCGGTDRRTADTAWSTISSVSSPSHPRMLPIALSWWLFIPRPRDR